MQIKEIIQGDVVVLIPKGNLMGEPETGVLREKIKSAISDGFLKVVLDVSKIKWINSSGLGALIAGLASLNGKGGDLRISNVTEKINSLFMITQLIKVFKSYDTTDRAVASYLIDPIAEAPSEDAS